MIYLDSAATTFQKPLSVSAFTSAADIDAFAHVLRSIVRG